MTQDIFALRLAKPMLLIEGEPFDSKDFLYELKLDGIRCLAYLDDYTELRNKRNKSVTEIYPELKNIHKQIKRKCILDGELIVTINGIPNFFEMQRRSLMTDPFKIELAGKNKPVSFVAYDILYVDNEEIIDKPLMERKEILFNVVQESSEIAISRFIEEKGIDFFSLVAKQDLEGVVAKKKTSLYYYGKRSKDWIKFKKLHDKDFVICGYVKDNETGGIKSVVIGSYRDDILIYQGHVALGIAKEDQKIIMDFASTNPSECPFSKEYCDSETLWIKPELVCTVKYMMRTPTNSLRQPIFKGLRNDKDPDECRI